MVCRDCAWIAYRDQVVIGICEWKSKELLPDSIIDCAPFIVNPDDDGEGCPQFKAREAK